MKETFQDQLTRRALEEVQRAIPSLVQSALTQAQDMGLSKVQDVVRSLPIPEVQQGQIIDVLEGVKVTAPPPTVVVETVPGGAPTKVDAAKRSWRTFVQVLLGVVLLAFGESFLDGLRGDGFDIASWVSWSTVLQASALAAVSAGIAAVMRLLSTRGT